MMTYRIVVRTVDAEEEIEASRFEDCPALIRAHILNNDLSAQDWLSAEVYLGDELQARLAFNGRKIG
jgi:hypothetical protein